mgnify:CR=1 FL=1
MAFAQSTFFGDETFSICCTGDAVKGDEVAFERAVFGGSFRKPTFEGFELVCGKIVADSYGRDKQQHTFTIELVDGSTTRIKGRNLYKNGVWRKRWENEDARRAAADEKHERGDHARAARQIRKEESNHVYC